MRHLITRLAPVALAVTITSPGAAQSEVSSDGLDEWREHLEWQTRGGSLWWTSNGAYETDDRGIDAYLMRYVMLPGGLAARGCLWGERDGEVLGPFWEFFMAWDVEAGQPLIYQVAPGGGSGIGHLSWEDSDWRIAEQTFLGPDGAVSRIRHETVIPDQDMHESKSLNWVDGRWAPRRTYTWVRRQGPAPC